MNSITISHFADIPDNYTGHVKHVNGYQEWLKNGEIHRENGPAIIWIDGTQSWYKNGKQHREDGPAVISANGGYSWCLDGDYYTRDNYYKELYKRGIITEQELFIELL